jgi:hypothetical protein
MKWEIGTIKQTAISLVFIGVVTFATISPHVANIHLALTLLLGGLHVYMINKWNSGQLKKTKDTPPSYAYAAAYVINLMVSVAFSWWFSSIIWLLILIIYIAVQSDPPNSSKTKNKDEEN